jgi:Ca2+-dependent lipid-binding protein
LSAEGDGEIKQYITPVNMVARLYILKGKSLTPKDATTSDPYLVIKLGGKTITDKESLRPKTCNPNFFRSYDLPVTLPGASTLEIECWDDDGFDFPDLIGATKIDLEDRFFNKEWKSKYKEMRPIEERTLFIKKSSAP